MRQWDSPEYDPPGWDDAPRYGSAQGCRGITLGLLVSVVMWLGIIAAVWLLLRG